nr:hypothetical protein CFP56_75702 [Quercus suber]
MQYSASMSPSLAQCVPNTTNGRLRFENMIMYKLGSSSLMAMLISPRSRKRKMAAGRGSCESALEELFGKLLCLTGGTHGLLAWAWTFGHARNAHVVHGHVTLLEWKARTAGLAWFMSAFHHILTWL